MQVVDLSEVRTPETPTEVESEQSWYREEIAIKTPSFAAVSDETRQAQHPQHQCHGKRLVNELLLRET